jgi:predicted  nucleic acid-binding Zn-ribbon protein
MSIFGASKRPDNWYSMSYEEQRTWERAERQHRDELDDVERRERQAREDAEHVQRRLDVARREHRAYVSELYEENERLSEELAETRTQCDELLAALKLCRSAINEEVMAAGDDDHPTIREHAKAVEQADVAIAKAEARQ